MNTERKRGREEEEGKKERSILEKEMAVVKGDFLFF